MVEFCKFGPGDCQFGFKESVCENWPTSGSDWLRAVPWGMRSILKYIDETYDSKKGRVYFKRNLVAHKWSVKGSSKGQ